MAPKQATLGKFFDSRNGSKAPPPQQAKLKFGIKSSSTATKDSEEAAPVSSGAVVDGQTNDPNGHVDEEGVKKEEATSNDRVERESKVKAEPTPTPASPRKRRASTTSTEEDVKNEDDEEPPSKKQRKSMKGTSKVKKGVASKKTAGKVGKKSEANDNQEAIRTIVSADDQNSMADDGAEEAPVESNESANASKADLGNLVKKDAASKNIDAPEDDVAEKQQSDTEGERSEEDEDDDEKAEVLSKARAKVQTTFTSAPKGAYPDWKAGEPVPYAALCTTFSKLELTTKRLEKFAILAALFSQVLRLTPDDLLPVVLLTIGKLAADYTGVELGIGESLIMKAIGETTGRNVKSIKEDQQKIGDLGLLAAKSRGNQPTMFKPKPLTARSVHEGLMKIATATEGQGSQGRKVDGIKKLLSAADVGLAKGQAIDIFKDKGGPSESKFIIRALEGKMRLGLADKNLQVALAHSMVAYAASKDGKKVPSDVDLKKGEEIFKAVYNELPSYEVIVPALLEGGIYNLREACKLQPGVPLKPMLAKPTKSIGEVLDRFEGKDFTCEYKYDGERAQIHFVAHDAKEAFATSTVAPKEGKSDRGVSNIFSRNSEDLSKKYPDILAKLPSWVRQGTKSFVLDCETCAWDVEAKHVLPFQQLMTRKKKDVKLEDVKVKVCVFAFDLLFLNGEALVNQPFRTRRDLMYAAFEEVEGEFSFAKFGNSHDIDEIQILLDDAIKASCEGLMVKMLDGVESHYEPSRRSQNWLKVKKDYLAGVGDSLDLVVLGAYYGKGKRTSVYGAFLLACRNSATDMYESVCNIGTGFSEALLAELYTTLSPLVIDRPKPFYDHSAGKNDQPDVWFEPRLVWEVKAADLTLSPRYRAAAAEFGGDGVHKGVSLRFPRYIRGREDKKPDEATSSKQVAEMYRRQETVGKERKAGVDDDFEY